MKTIIHIYTDGGYNKVIDKSYYGFIIYKDDGKSLNILNTKTKKVNGMIDFELAAVELAYQYLLTTTGLSTYKLVVHTEILKLLQGKHSETRIKFEKLLGKRKVSFEYSPAHEYDLFNNLIDTLISDNNVQTLIKDFVNAPGVINKANKTYIEMDTKGIINMFLLLYRIKLEAVLVSDTKKEKLEKSREVYNDFFIDRVIYYRGKRMLYL
jgi:hypothetical protein